MKGVIINTLPSAAQGKLIIGDEAIEEVFLAAASMPNPHDIQVILAPCDLRTKPVPELDPPIAWYPELCESIRNELKKLDGQSGR